MFKIDCNNRMTDTKGDSAFINFRCANYKLKEGDNVILTIWDGERAIVTKQDDNFTEEGFICIELDAEDTNQSIKEYDYTIRVVTPNGIDETVIKNILNVI